VGLLGAAVVGLLFPGQGSQFVGMGRELADASTAARLTFEEADDVLGFPLSRLCWDGPEPELTATSVAQPALLTHSIAVLRTVEERLGPVQMAAGHSLGEFTAYVAAGTLTFADGLRTVRRRGELMQESGTQRPGAMAALLGLDDEAVEQLCRDATREGGECVPANFNSPGQLVISGDVAAIERAMELARSAGARKAIRLNVSGAFHSPLMAAAQRGLIAQLDGVKMTRPAFPVVSNVTAQPVSAADTARRLLVEQLTSPVRWTACMRTMLDAGVTRFRELGPGNVLTGLLRRVDRGVDGAAVGGVADLESAAA
jgi:[acyl-carrier-protein] S-malonyltransferase